MKNFCHPYPYINLIISCELAKNSMLGGRIIDEWKKSYLMTRASKFKHELVSYHIASI